MSDLDATTPRVFLVRHGETEWTKNGRYTGTTDLELTPAGETQVRSTASKLVGPGKLIDPKRVVKVWVSPRKRAVRTFEILFNPSSSSSSSGSTSNSANVEISIEDEKVNIAEELAEWDYGNYEGWVVADIRKRRREQGLDGEREWNIWRDGCDGGEPAQQVTDRLDRLIAKIKEVQRPNMHGEKPADIVLVGHGLNLRAFVKRWLKYPLDFPMAMMLSPGAIGILSYRNHDIDEPGFFIGVALPSDQLD
ncbi:putative phosphoglycerate mutase [Stipitochalara longipes BDJ]|nr:putative phosphoglycerate mutase [Stipitochalara longipes BDJ]